ncbi:inactive protein RESTRICTED TEV MOVEMENT 2-like [Lotus japonicus]|uniref:inactive protein RESTRICTED TEV MOVEMENT 2-like n=1 Tax=Lotus japonicus TaxID=34305 RepID=UPI0025838FAC|nr:inactive protein RESTRICTED TEV MOVEMENT 2-like [Lotus japonicus]
METNAAGATKNNRLYEEFEPYCKWLTKEGQKILDIDLKGFKKEQLKVQTNNRGVLTIYGERPLGGASSTKWSRFHKEIRISKDCDVNGVQAKFSHGTLSIVIPKKSSPIQQAKGEAMEKYSISKVETRKRTAIKVAIGLLAVVALGTYIARLVVNRNPHGAVE